MKRTELNILINEEILIALAESLQVPVAAFKPQLINRFLPILNKVVKKYPTATVSYPNTENGMESRRGTYTQAVAHIKTFSKNIVSFSLDVSSSPTFISIEVHSARARKIGSDMAKMGRLD